MIFNTKKILSVLGLLIIITFSACNKYLDSLALLPETSYYDLPTAFSTVSNATSVLNGAYQSFQGDAGFGIRMSLYYPQSSDESITSGALDNARRAPSYYAVNASNTELEKPYRRMYDAVERANLCIEQIPLMKTYNGADSITLHSLHAQALAIRALAYHELIKNFGDVPGIFVPAYRLPYNFVFTKMDRDSIYDQILLKDLPLAINLSRWSIANPTRFSKAAIKALRARIALFRGGYSLRRASSIYGQTMARPSDYLNYYTIARDECYGIITNGQNNLNPKYEDIFHKYICGLQNDPTGEMLYQVAMDDGQTNGGETSSKLGYYNGPKLGANCSYGPGGGGILMLPSYFYAFDSTDPRRDVTIAAYARPGTNTVTPDIKTVPKITSIYDGKFRRDWRNPVLNSTSNYLGYDWPVIRYADVLLMYAEAENELNGPANAITYFENVRKRSLGANIGSTPTDKQGFFEAIVKERSLELGGEGLRKFDLIRWNLLKTKIDETKANMNDMFASGGPVGKYAGYPTSMYYTNNGNEIVWQNSFYVAPVGGVSGTSVDWCKSGSTPTTYVLNFAQYFTPNHSELLPIAQSIIDASNGSLKNDYGY